MTNPTTPDSESFKPTRRGFLGGLLAFPSALYLGATDRLFLWKTLRRIDTGFHSLDHFFIAGFQFHQGQAIASTLKPACVLDARREPDNPHDERAIALYFRDRKLGYVPKRRNRVISKLMDGEFLMRFEVVQAQEDAPTWERVKVAVLIARPNA